MRSPLSRLIEALDVRFLHIRHYDVGYVFQSGPRALPHAVLWYVDEGAFTFTLDGAEHRGEAGQVIYLSPKSTFSFSSLSYRMTLTSINFDAEITFLSHRIWSDVLRFPVQHAYSEAVMGEVRAIFRQMRAQAESQSISVHLTLRSGLERLLALLLHDFYQGRLTDNEAHFPTDTRVETAVDYLRCHPERFPELSELCALVHLSEAHLRRLFVAHTGLPPLQFTLQLKTEVAKKQLVSTNVRVGEIAHELGFTDVGYFTRQFKRRTGYAPQSYREKFRNWLE